MNVRFKIRLRMFLLMFAALLFVTGVCAETNDRRNEVSDCFQKIRGNEAMLRMFFANMPKGGDLHLHLTGAVYAETYFDIACQDGLYLDTLTFILGTERIANALKMSPDMPNLHKWKVKCIDTWSVRNFKTGHSTTPPDEFFFSTFLEFAKASSKKHYARLLNELKLRAEAENVSYLEIMVESPPKDPSMFDMSFNNAMVETIIRKDEGCFAVLLEQLYSQWEADRKVQNSIITTYVDSINSYQNKTLDTAPKVKTLYQAYAGRNDEPMKVFAQLYIGYKACGRTQNLVGVNIAQAENGEKSLRDYWGHMQMYKFLNAKMTETQASLHAGEFTLGLVPPEDMQDHIRMAVYNAGAKRIGHGVDIPFEKSAPELLTHMASAEVVVEINLSSNEFILGVRDDSHPILLYYKNNVPIVISTDDPGILRTNLTQEYVIAAQRYPELEYKDFVNFAYNSIRYSFADSNTKKELQEDIDKRFETFENLVINYFKICVE